MPSPTTEPDWIAVDWGTSNLRCWAMDANGQVLAEAVSDKGMAALAPAEFEGVLLSVIEDWLGDAPIAVVACGMVGSRQGWAEAPYAVIPCLPHGMPVAAKVQDERINVHILSGLKQLTPPNVMRGEETQIAGFIAGDPEFSGNLCLPGTHSKWVGVSRERGVTGFETYMTGELFALLSKHSVLRHSIGASAGDGFDEAVAEAMKAPESVVTRLFEIRAGDLLNAVPSADARARLSGLLIGAELAAARHRWHVGTVGLIGAPDLTDLYARALATQGVEARITDGTSCTLSGLTAAYREFVA